MGVASWPDVPFTGGLRELGSEPQVRIIQKVSFGWGGEAT